MHLRDRDNGISRLDKHYQTWHLSALNPGIQLDLANVGYSPFAQWRRASVDSVFVTCVTYGKSKLNFYSLFTQIQMQSMLAFV